MHIFGRKKQKIFSKECTLKMLIALEKLPTGEDLEGLTGMSSQLQPKKVLSYFLLHHFYVGCCAAIASEYPSS